jgi:hypothetical protein
MLVVTFGYELVDERSQTAKTAGCSGTLIPKRSALTSNGARCRFVVIDVRDV